ncbi:hypothetical protein GWO43_15970 [candidate division KSB1 bacterium]|nr:hypothetical protein [candidate division KSB1 bacterium]NIV68729.1 hypothetical protein [Phycisphaerae bacterium]NIS25448.1 hypothetical protein [candidate division KSB1 bacterium]NIT72340.1 hypothetical protein [candidate division KSB1 bacterium]NIU26125.1 hypothetical protein [candidate division KSB1 bacterium]
MIAPEWGCIAGMQVQEDGVIGLVWLAHDKKVDTLHLYDALVFEEGDLAILAHGINVRGRHIPIAWANKEMADRLKEEYGCNMLPEAVSEKPEFIEVTSKNIRERMKTGRFKVDAGQKEWLKEFNEFHRHDAKIPIKAFPLMAATNHAVAGVKFARRSDTPHVRRSPYPEVSII